MNKKCIRPIAICLFRHGDKILVADYPDTIKQDFFCRPLGGEIEFGEHSRDAIIREIKEELNAAITQVSLVGVLENRFIYEGWPGHEIVFVYDAQFLDKTLYQQKTLRGYEHGVGLHFQAEWRSLAEIEQSEVRLVPEALSTLL
ncbi:MAG: NUDIX domain-containing protein [Anaerolineae bacterium]|nr:NUDIX domain-containing protein [Anaerolineae bacterium]